MIDTILTEPFRRGFLIGVCHHLARDTSCAETRSVLISTLSSLGELDEQRGNLVHYRWWETISQEQRQAMCKCQRVTETHHNWHTQPHTVARCFEVYGRATVGTES